MGRKPSPKGLYVRLQEIPASDGPILALSGVTRGRTSPAAAEIVASSPPGMRLRPFAGAGGERLTGFGSACDWTQFLREDL